jgi:transketolase
MDKNSINKIKKFSYNLRKTILDTALIAGHSSSHFGGALSSTEIVSTLYSHIMSLDPKDALWEERDRFILSKGHACLVLYSALAEVGYIKKEDLKNFEKSNSDFPGHPVMNKKIGIEFSTGSLGMGLSLGIGVAISSKKKQKKFNTYVLIGDGECNEGSVWEAAMLANHLKLNNLTAILDNNGFQQTGTNNDILQTNSLLKMWSSFGWDTIEVDGHNIEELVNAFNFKSNKPKMIIAKTIKGKGFSFSENNNDWHHKILTKEQYDIGLRELKKNEF